MQLRSCLVYGVALATFAMAAEPADPYPSKPIKIIVPSAPGAASDVAIRLIGRLWQDRWKQPVIVENKPGASGLIGAEAIKNSLPDGYTLGTAVSSSHASAPHVFKKLPYDPIKDFECIGLVGRAGQLLLVPATSPYRSLIELVAFTKANPGKVFFGHYNNLSLVTAELLNERAKIQMDGVPYKLISTAMTDLIGGQIQVMFVDYLTASPHLRAGRVIPLGITDEQRHPLLPDVPSVAETFPGFDMRGFISLIVPRGVSKEIIYSLNQALREAQTDPAFRTPIEKTGATINSSTPEECRTFMVQEIERWGQYVKAAKIEAQ